MEEVSLTETETRYYGDLFLCCDVEKTGKISMLKATELYRSANLPDDVISEITSLAGIPSTALHISRAQFYSCLKLIAAHQASIPLRQELIAATVQLPMPRFSWKDSPNGPDDSSFSGIHNQANGLNALPPPPPMADRRSSLTLRGDWSEVGSGHADPSVSSRRNSSTQQHQHQHQHPQQQQEAAINSDVPSTDSEVDQNESSCGGEGGGGGTIGPGGREGRRGRGSPEAWSTNSDSPTPTNSVAERPWAKETLWQGLLGDEHRQLLGTEEESSDRHSSDDDNDGDLEAVYQITPEQREYYYKQFKAVQHDPNGLLSGQAARVFFEKSRIPVEELRHIWQLCDVTRDGALSLAEFTAAMHLVVLRRNNIPLPASLPACLHPSVLQHATLASQLPMPAAPAPSAPPQEPPEADLLHLNDDDDEDNTDNTIIGASVSRNATAVAANEKNVMNLSTLSASSQTSVGSARHAGNASTNRGASLTPPPLPPPIKNRSISNSPNLAEPIQTPPILPGIAAAAVAGVKPFDRALWTTADVPPSQWTKFTESPTSNVSSPGPKPVNFDMQRTAQAVVSDPQILHPVPLRVTPVAGALASASSSTAVTTSSSTAAGNGASATDMLNHEAYDGATLREPSPKHSNSIGSANSNSSGNNVSGSNSNNNTISNNSNNTTATAQLGSALHHRDSLTQNNDLRAIQRPQAKKLLAKNIGALPPPPQRESSIGSVGSGACGGAGGDGGALDSSNGNQTQAAMSTVKKDAPPLPPPRPHRHGRSSSLDLNKFKISGGGAPAQQQPEITAQASFDMQTSSGFADFTHFPDGIATNDIICSVAEPQQHQHSLPPQSGDSNTQPMSLPPSRFCLQTSQRVSAFEVYRKPNTPRNSQSPPAPPPQPVVGQASQAPQPPPPGSAGAPFGAAGSAILGQQPTTATTTVSVLPNADVYEKRVNAISETLRHVSFKTADNSMTDVLRHLREQNHLLLRLCNDLSDELLTVQTRKEELRVKLESAGAMAVMATTSASAAVTAAAVTASSSSANNETNNNLTVPARTGSSISAPVTANVTGGSGSSGVHSNI